YVGCSDLPEERSTVLLLGVTRIPTTPLPARRPCSLPLAPNNSRITQGEIPQIRRNSLSSTRRSVVRRNSSKKREGRHCQVPTLNVSSVDDHRVKSSSRRCSDSRESPASDLGSVTPSNCVSHDSSSAALMMERSVDSIGACSLDVEASAELSDWSEISSVGTLRSASIVTPSPEPHLPSYLSLACTVNGYSTTTNYDPIRLARSRDASPHRIDSDLTSNKVTYSIQNNLLSPPNLVPLPTCSKPKVTKTSKMGENTLAHHNHQEFYSSSKTMSFMSKDTHFTSNLFTTKDSIDGCLENGHHTIHSKCVSFESKNITSFENKNITTINGQSKCTSETSLRQEYSNGTETKSFIQQRVERLYGPGALAQGFFVTKRQKNRLSESEEKNASTDSDQHSKSLSDKLLEDDDLEPTMKQSTSSPTLPVLRHLRPEFRAQLPIIIPKLKDEVKVNGHSKIEEVNLAALKDSNNGVTEPNIKKKSVESARAFDLHRADSLNFCCECEATHTSSICTQSVGEAFPTTNEDLQGFWDMVMLQVDKDDHKVKTNGTIGTVKTRKITNRPKPMTAANEEARKQRETQRKKMIEERRKAMKAQQSKPRESIEIFVPESS
ncbi:hypothetical protein NQ314_011938, partial [Rhamnusium bicolor]